MIFTIWVGLAIAMLLAEIAFLGMFMGRSKWWLTSTGRIMVALFFCLALFSASSMVTLVGAAYTLMWAVLRFPAVIGIIAMLIFLIIDLVKVQNASRKAHRDDAFVSWETMESDAMRDAHEEGNRNGQ